jgi:homoserine acetyltransferase
LRSRSERHRSPDYASHHVFTLAQFTFENGTTVPNVMVVCGTYGRLNARKDHVILPAVALPRRSSWLRQSSRYRR